MNVSGPSHPGSPAIGAAPPPPPPPRADNDGDADGGKAKAAPSSGTAPGAAGSQGLLDINA